MSAPGPLRRDAPGARALIRRNGSRQKLQWYTKLDAATASRRSSLTFEASKAAHTSRTGARNAAFLVVGSAPNNGNEAPPNAKLRLARIIFVLLSLFFWISRLVYACHARCFLEARPLLSSSSALYAYGGVFPFSHLFFHGVCPLSSVSPVASVCCPTAYGHAGLFGSSSTPSIMSPVAPPKCANGVII